MKKHLLSEHKTIYNQPDTNPFGYFAWPTLAKLDNGELILGASGFRNSHLCPFGKGVIMRSYDHGDNWTEPEIVINSPIDNRDVGITPLDKGRFLMSWFTSDTRESWRLNHSRMERERHGISYQAVFESWNDEMVRAHWGSFTRIYDPASGWGPIRSAPVSAPHGPIRLRNGSLLYLGVVFNQMDIVRAMRSYDEGATWEWLGIVPNDPVRGCEPHLIELRDGRLMGMIRQSNPFTCHRTFSSDGGASWSKPEYIMDGAPPFLLRHSSGVILCAYGFRSPPYGQRVIFSCDEGVTWDMDWIVREDESGNNDLGYHSCIEQPDGSLLSVYYQRPRGNMHNTALLCSRWRLPETLEYSVSQHKKTT